MNKKLSESFINQNEPIKKAVEMLERTEKKTLFVINDQEQFIGLVNDGDIRRALLNGISEENPIYRITNCSTITDVELAKARIKKTDARYIVVPLLDKERRVVDCTVVTQKTETPFITTPHKFNRVLVIGGAGYLGSILCRKLLKKGYKVRVLDCLLYGDEGIRELYPYSSFEFTYGDMRNLKTLVNSIADVDAVIHLAAIVGDPASALNPSETIQTNYLATRMVAEVCRFSHINRLIFASTCSVYGASKQDELLYETSPLNPVSLYAQMKIKSEEALLEMKNNSFKPVIFRMATLHGKSPRQRFDLAVNIMTMKALFDHKITVHGGTQYRAFCHVSDAADAYIKCLETPLDTIKDTIYNIASENLQILHVAKTIEHYIPDSSSEIVDIEDKRNYIVSGKNADTTFSLHHKFLIDDTVQSLIKDKEKFKDFENKKYSNIKYLSES